MLKDWWKYDTMPTYTNIQSYRRAWRSRLKALRKGADKSSKQTARLVIAEARTKAPKDKGEILRGLRIRKKKNGEWAAESWVPGRFKQNLWTNRTPPFKKPKMVWNDMKPTLYGNGTHSPTGIPGWWNISVRKASKVFSKIARGNTRKALRVTV